MPLELEAGGQLTALLGPVLGEDRELPDRLGFGHRPLADLVREPELLAEVQDAVDEANSAVSKAESIRKFTILPEDWTEEGGQLTPSLKLKRHLVLRQCKDEIAFLYQS